MAFTQTDIDTLKAAIATSGVVRSITFSDQSVTFANLDEMLRLLALMQAEVNGVAGTPRNYRLAVTSKGV